VKGVLRSGGGARIADRSNGHGTNRGVIYCRKGDPGTPTGRAAQDPLFAQLAVAGIAQQWLEETSGKVSIKSDTATAVRYTLGCWEAPLRYGDDCGLLIENNAAERALRVVALEGKNFLFAGFDGGDQSAALIYSLIGTAKLNYLNPEGYLPKVLSRIPENPINRIAELLPTNIETGCTDDVLRTD
jgi:hypothetical protein